jgi:hypothetical protein
MRSTLRIKEKFKFFSNSIKKNFPQLRCKKYGCHQGAKARSRKNTSHFSFVASRLSTTGGQVWLNSIFVKNCFIAL